MLNSEWSFWGNNYGTASHFFMQQWDLNFGNYPICVLPKPGFVEITHRFSQASSAKRDASWIMQVVLMRVWGQSLGSLRGLTVGIGLVYGGLGFTGSRSQVLSPPHPLKKRAKIAWGMLNAGSGDSGEGMIDHKPKACTRGLPAQHQAFST